eukprot:3512503-Pyramimonas_sp.AAC.1
MCRIHVDKRCQLTGHEVDAEIAYSDHQPDSWNCCFPRCGEEKRRQNIDMRGKGQTASDRLSGTI